MTYQIREFLYSYDYLCNYCFDVHLKTAQVKHYLIMIGLPIISQIIYIYLLVTEFYPFVIQLLWWGILENWTLNLFDIRFPLCFTTSLAEQKLIHVTIAHTISQIDSTLPCICLTNRFHVVMGLFSNRSQMTSKCGKNKKVAHEAQPSVSLIFLPHFDVLCDLLLNRHTATWNLFVLYNKKLNYTEKNAFLIQISLLWQTQK